MKNLDKRIALLLSLVAVAALATSGCSSAQAQQNPDSSMSMSNQTVRTITVSGTGTTRAEPDEAVASFGFTEKARDLRDAHAAVQQRVQEFVDAVAAAGWDRDLVRQSGMNYQPNYDYMQNEGQVFRDFSASVTLTFRTETLSDVPGILNLAVEHGVTEIRPVQYSVIDRASKEGDARKNAIDNARLKAEELAAAAGATLGRVITISEGGGGGGPQPYPMMRSMAADSEAADFADVSPNQVQLDSSVSVTWELR